MGQTVEKPQWLTLPEGNSESEGFTKTNSRAQPKCLYLEKPEAFKLSEGGVFPDNPKAFQQLSDFGFLEVQGQTPHGCRLELF